MIHGGHHGFAGARQMITAVGHPYRPVRALPRLVRLPSEGTDDFIFLTDLVTFHAARMYHGYDIVSSAAFRVTRNSNLYLAEEESRSLLESVRTELHNRRKGDAVRLESDRSVNFSAKSVPFRCWQASC